MPVLPRLEARARAAQAAFFRQQARALLARLRAPRPARPKHRLALALQGGGAHGAFTWGVLDRLLEEPGFRPEAISGTSAGAMNAVALAAGWLDGGAAGARARLDALWHAVAGLSPRAPAGRGVLSRFTLDLTAHVLSPYQLNPLGLNPLQDVLTRLIDFERLRAPDAPRLLIAATDVESGEARLFENAELEPACILASTCLPQAFHAVRVGGRAYWDGGYASNPPLVPLIERVRPTDVLLVQINPLQNRGLPTAAGDIRNRTAEIMFGRPLASELQALAERRRGVFARLDPARRPFAAVRLETIDGAPALAGLDPVTRILPDLETLLQLKTLGRAAVCRHPPADVAADPTREPGRAA